jgi:hypothetical protein
LVREKMEGKKKKRSKDAWVEEEQQVVPSGRSGG